MTEAAAVFALATALFAVGAGIIAAFGGTTARAGGGGELWRHYGATVLFAAAVLVPAAVHPALFALVAAMAAWRGANELAALHGLHVGRAAQAGIAAAVLAAAWIGREPAWLMPACAALAAVSVPSYAQALRRPLEDAMRWPFALGWPLVAVAQLSYLAHAERGFLWICLVYVVVEVQDSMAFLFGKLFGRRPLAPRLSPRKTVEGAIAGAAWGIAVGVLMATQLLGLGWAAAFALAALVAAAGFGGDLFASALKRAAGVKDFRALHARHGGVLDIYDSTLAAAPVAGLFLWILS
jgi:phosphatidate cytidylyltransferase